MQQRMKQRLIGAIVLVALAVIFLPMLLQGPVEREATSIPMEIPPRPQVSMQAPASSADSAAQGVVASPFAPAEPVAAPVAAPAGEPKPAAAPKPAPEPAAAPVEPAPAPAPVLAEEPAPQPRTPSELAAWAVQVGSFGTESNALKLRDSLRSKGYNAYTERTRSNGKSFYRVRVGPTIERAEAEQLRATLASKETLKGLVVPHP